uniref:Suppressor of cytokine signaling 7 n=1 Tax=Ceratitis capitata TaxID=7213 RepID=W8C688_CERCA
MLEMDTTSKDEDSNCNFSTPSFANSSAVSSILQMCQSSCSDYVGVLPPPIDMASVNSVELNAQTSLSDDSGVPLTTNSSISSGDSYRMGLCKHELEIVESDGEVSQFDSLDNCSEAGMSAENFNTLKKGPLAPIDPPLEFQDSPNITMGRCIKQKLRRLSSSHSSLEYSKESEYNENNIHGEKTCCKEADMEITTQYLGKPHKELYLMKKPIYSSDSILTNKTENVYDEPNNVICNYALTNTEVFEQHTNSISLSLPQTSLPPERAKRDLCPYYEDHSMYFKAIPSEQDSIMSTAKFNTYGLSEIHDYDLYYGIKRNAVQCENGLQKKVLYSPRKVTNYCHSHHIYAGPNGGSNRPNSRNSLNSRLSSSHNSLNTSSANKPDDSIFITQAMSHDALLTREISDFYNVPIDSDIYALPIDMIQTDKNCRLEYKEDKIKDYKKLNNLLLTDDDYSKHSKLNRKNNRNKRKKRNSETYESDVKCDNYKFATNALKLKNKKADTLNESEDYGLHTSAHTLLNSSAPPQERLNMTLNEVKKYYQTIYTRTKNRSSIQNESDKIDCVKPPIELGGNDSSPCSRINQSSNEENNSAECKTNIRTSKSYNENNDKINNNNLNNIVLANNYSITENQMIKADDVDISSQVVRNEKKTQFSLNLKQKFCNIFRIRRTQPQSQTNTPEERTINRERRSTVEKHKKVQSRALPPLPKKTESIMTQNKGSSQKKQEGRTLQFTSSIEKVKDYGWYWGPLSSEAAEKVLSTESDGSFIVRDSSDDHYIFSLSFKLNNCVRHVRIEQDQGTFSFGSYAKFKSQTITEFIEKAVEHSRSGRYLFFLHRRPEHGPMRVQLTNPVSRFKHVQSLQHMCRFVILKTVIRKDLIQTLPLPRRLLDYLNYKHCFSEQIEFDSSQAQNLSSQMG